MWHVSTGCLVCSEFCFFLLLVFQRSTSRQTTAGTQMETPDRGASPPARLNDGNFALYRAAVSPSDVTCLYCLVNDLIKVSTFTKRVITLYQLPHHTYLFVFQIKFSIHSKNGSCIEFSLPCSLLSSVRASHHHPRADLCQWGRWSIPRHDRRDGDGKNVPELVGPNATQTQPHARELPLQVRTAKDSASGLLWLLRFNQNQHLRVGNQEMQNIYRKRWLGDLFFWLSLVVFQRPGQQLLPEPWQRADALVLHHRQRHPLGVLQSADLRKFNCTR